MKRVRILTAILGGTSLLLLVFAAWKPLQIYWLRTSYTIPEGTVGAESPQRWDGTFDFTDVLNDLLAGDISPNDNAAVPLLYLVPPDKPQLELRKQSIQKLGLEWDPERVVSFIEPSLFQIHIAVTKLSDAEMETARRWVDQHPHVLATLTEAAQKPAIFIPYVNWDDGRPLSELRLDLSQIDYQLVNDLCLASVIECDRENLSASVDHLINAHRLWRYFQNLPNLAASSQGIWQDEQLEETGRHLFRSGKLSAEHCERLLTSFGNLPEMASIESIFNTHLRLMTIDQTIGRKIMQLEGHIPIDPFTGTSSRPSYSISRPPRSFDELLDRFRDVKRYPPSEEANQLLAKITKLFDDGTALLQQSRFREFLDELKLSDRKFPYEIDQTVNLVVSWPPGTWMRRLVAEQHLDQLELALLIEQYRHRNGELPEDLTQLAASYDDLPLGYAFERGSLEFRRDGDTFGFYRITKSPSGESEATLVFPTGR